MTVKAIVFYFLNYNHFDNNPPIAHIQINMSYRSILQNRFFYWILAIIIPLLAINNAYFPFSGVAFSGILLTIFTLISKPKITRVDWILALVAVVSAINFFFKTSFLPLFLSGFLWFYSSSWLVDKGISRTINMFFPWVYSFFSVWGTKDTLLKLSLGINKEHSTKLQKNLNSYLINSAIAVGVLTLIVPFLGASNAYFATFMNQIFDGIRSFFSSIFGDLGIFTYFQILVFVFLVNFLPRQYLFLQKPEQDEPIEKSEFSLFVAKCAVAITLCIFLFVQLQTSLNPALLNSSPGKVVNEVFFYLSVVCFVVFGLLYINLRANLWTRILSGILLAQAFLLGLIAFKSDWTYITDWGLTHKRLYGLVVLTIILLNIIIFVSYLLMNKIKSFNLPIFLTLAFCIIGGITNLINFDYLIYHNAPKESKGVELNYISAMSLDSYSLKEELEKQIKEVGNYNETCVNYSWLGINYGKVTYLKEKYSKLQILGFNYNEFQNYKDIKDLNLTEMNKSRTNNNPNPTTKCYQNDFQKNYNNGLTIQN
jgi:Domain of unknown function (DUF4173)